VNSPAVPLMHEVVSLFPSIAIFDPLVTPEDLKSLDIDVVSAREPVGGLIVHIHGPLPRLAEGAVVVDVRKMWRIPEIEQYKAESEV